MRVFGRYRNFVLVQDAGDDAGIGHAGDLDVAQVVLDSVALGEDALEGLDAGAAGMDQGAVNVEEEKALYYCGVRVVRAGRHLWMGIAECGFCDWGWGVVQELTRGRAREGDY